MSEKQRYRIGVDLGTSSVGLAVYSLNENNKINKLEHLDSYIFGEPVNPKDMTTLNGVRRSARLIRRQTERKAARLKKLSYISAAIGVSRDKLEEIKNADVHGLRAKAVSEKIALPELIKVFSHIIKNRGYKGSLSDEEKGKIGKKIGDTEKLLEGGKTLGQVLYERKTQAGGGAWRKLNEGGTFVYRENVEEEFKLIWLEQSKHHKELSGNYKTTYDNMFPDHNGKKEISLHEAFKSAMFYQRPVRWELDSVGSCPFEPREKRAALAQTAYQNYRLAKNISNLRIKGSDEPLSAAQMGGLYDYIEINSDNYAKNTGKISYAEIYQKLGLADGVKFSADRKNGGGEGIKGNTTLKAFYDAGVLNDWSNLTDKAQELAIEFLSNITKYSDIQDNENGAIKKFFSELTKNIIRDEKDAVAASDFIILLKSKKVFTKDFRLEQGRAPYGASALAKITAELLKGKEEIKIIEELYPREEQELRDSMRPYEEIKRQESINDAVMAKALREFKRVMDYALRKFGQPEEIVIELSRDIKNSLRKRQYLESENKKAREERLKAVNELQDREITVTSKNTDKYLLWIEQDKTCPYCGQPISNGDAFDENKTQIDHIIHQSIGGPNIFSNKVLAHTPCNKEKNNRVPYEWKFSKDIEDFNAHNKSNKGKRKSGEETEKFGFHSPLINFVERLRGLYNKEKKGFYNQKKRKSEPTQKGKRILQKINNLLIKPEDIKEEFAARQNQETAWIGKIVMDWCKDICPKVTPSFGGLTAYLRGQLHFDKVLPDIRIEEGKPLFDEDGKEIPREIWLELFAKRDLDYKEAKALKEEFERHLSSLETPPNNDTDRQKEFRHFCADKRRVCKFNKRCDRRHHAVDAAVIGLCDLSMVQRASAHNARYGTLHKIKDKDGNITNKGFMAEENIAPLYDSLKGQVKNYLNGYTVWHKPDHFPSGKFFDETAYNVAEKDGEKRFVIRQTLEKVLNKEKDKNKFIKKLEEVVVGEEIKKEIIKQLNERLDKGMSLEEAFAGNGEKGYLTFRKNKINKLAVFYKEKYLMRYNDEVDKQVDGIKYYQNAGYACMDFNKETGALIKAVPIWEYKKEGKIQDNIERVFANDMFFDKKSKNFYKVKRFAAAQGRLVGVSPTESQGEEKFFGNIGNIIVAKDRADVAKIKKEYGK